LRAVFLGRSLWALILETNDFWSFPGDILKWDLK